MKYILPLACVLLVVALATLVAAVIVEPGDRLP